MKLISALSIIFFLLSFGVPPRGIYDIKIKDIDGDVTTLSKYHGKKMVFVVLSGKENDPSLNDLAAFCTRYKDSAVVFGILSIEDGYTETSKGPVKNLFKSRIPGLILTEAMYTRKASAMQSELMQWFTHTELNRHFGNDINGTGWKFFVDGAGELYGALGPRTLLSDPVIARVMSKRVKPVQTIAPVSQQNNQALPTHH